MTVRGVKAPTPFYQIRSTASQAGTHALCFLDSTNFSTVVQIVFIGHTLPEVQLAVLPDETRPEAEELNCYFHRNEHWLLEEKVLV